MPFSLILKRMSRNARDMILLCVAISLVAGFFAFAPLYLRSVGESGLRYAVSTAPPGSTNLLVHNDVRTDLRDRSILQDGLGDLIASVETTTRSGQVLCYPYNQANVCFGDEGRAYISVGFENLIDRFTVTQGEYPDAPGEGAVTAEVANFSRLNLGDRLEVRKDATTSVEIEIVGILEPVNPADPFWLTQVATTRGILVDVTDNFQRFDFGLILPDEYFDEQILPISAAGVEYEWYVATNPDAMRAASLEDLAARIDEIGDSFRLKYQRAEVRGGLPILIDSVQSGITSAEGTVILFAAGVLFLMLYQLTAISSLVLETQTSEWASISSRGGSITQLVQAQLIAMGILGAAAALFGLGFAYLLLVFIGQTGPLASVVGAGGVDLPPVSIALSVGASLLAILALTLPALPAARRGILALKQAMSRPTSQPIWARYYLDIGLLALGIALILRLYFLTGGDDPGALLNDPSILIRLISAAGAQDAGLLRDPFNMIAAALIVTGLGMLWLRLFPLILRVFSTVGERLNSLLVSLAFWNVARDPNHYAQLVLVLIVTLGIGTASLALAATHDAGAWAVAGDQTGADVRITFKTEPPVSLDLPDVTHTEPVARYTTIERAGERTTTLFGIDPATFAQSSPGASGAADMLAGIESSPLPGQPLPDGTTAISIQVYAEPLESGETLHTRLGLEIENSIGVRYTVPLAAEDDTLSGTFQLYRADLPADAYLPIRLAGFRFLSRIDLSATFNHTVFLDDLTAYDAAGTATELDSFERTTMPEWTVGNRSGIGQTRDLFVTPTQAQSETGSYSLRADYSINKRGVDLVEPVLQAYPVSGEFRLPVVLSSAAADTLGRRVSAVRRAYREGDQGVLTLQLAQGVLEVPIRVVGVVPSFPTMNAGDFFSVSRTEDLRRALNVIATPDTLYTANERWLTLTQREPSAAFREALAGFTLSAADVGTTSALSAEGTTTVALAWDRYNALLRVPLPNAVAGVLFAGFWVALALGLLDFAFYLAMTARRRANSFAVLRALGWKAERLWGMLTVEQTALVIPALVIGVGLGGLLAYLLLPFLALIGEETLRFPLGQIGGLLAALVIGFAALMAWAALNLRRMSVNQMLRAGDE